MIFISDVHSNYIALKEILESMDRNDLIVHAGDVVGYNPYPNETISLFQQYKVLSIAGNHDRSVVNDDYTDFGEYAKIAAIWTAGRLSTQSRHYLASLNSSIVITQNNKKIAVHHGAPFNEDYYVYEEDVSESLLQYDHANILVLGHTHIPYIKKFQENIICNPGSVGQPRDGNNKASFIIIDLETMDLEIRRVAYNIKEVIEAIQEEGLPRFLEERLLSGI